MRDTREVSAFHRDLKRAVKRGKNLDKLRAIIMRFAKDEALPAKYRPHRLIGKWAGLLECHIEPAWLLVYQVTEEEVILPRTGSHADVFG